MECTVTELKSVNAIKECQFFTGVPDSLLTDFIRSIDKRKNVCHLPAVNEAHAVAIAFGAMLAGKEACVYLQNSGLGNIVNPISSLCTPSCVYPFLIIGHRHTLEQHKVMGKTDASIMQLLNYPKDRYAIVSGSNNEK